MVDGPQAEEAGDSIERWRGLLLERVLLLTLAAQIAVLAVLFGDRDMPQRGLLLYGVLPGVLFVAPAVFLPHAPTRYRQVAMVVGLLTAIVGGTSRIGFLLPNGFVGMLLLTVLATLVMGKRAGWVIWGVGLACFAGVAAYFTIGGAPTLAAALVDQTLPKNWLRVISVYGLVAGVAVAAVSYLSDRMIEAMRRSSALFGALTRESSQRIAALEEQRALEEQLLQSQKLEALGTLAGGVAHDFNNLLVVIINQAEMLRNKALPGAADAGLSQIQLAGQRAADLTRQLLMFASKQVTERAAVDFDAQVEESVRMLRRLLPETVDVKIRTGTRRMYVWAGAVEIDQVVLNLCVNARDAMPHGGTLTLSTSRENSTPPGQDAPRECARLLVEDTGSGMDATTRARALEPFFTTKPAGSGSGLGLSMVHGIVAKAGGTVSIDSAPGRGTRVYVEWPAHDGADSDTARPADRSRATGSQTVLVVDDDAGVRAVLKAQLERHGYRVVLADNGERALHEFEQHATGFDLVISDVVMPVMGGAALHDRLVKTHGELPFLVCSGYAAEALPPDFFDPPLRAFLPKPFSSKTLLQAVSQLLEAKAAHAEASPDVVTTPEPDPTR